MTPNDRIIGLIRTYVPYAVGAAVAWILARFAFQVDADTQAAVVAFGIVVVQNVYYALSRLAESKFPELGVLLGIPEAPSYQNVSDLWASIVRTGIPTIVGAVVAFFIAKGIHLGTGEAVIITALVQAAYYALARVLETRFPWTNVLLGNTAQPVYPARHVAE